MKFYDRTLLRNMIYNAKNDKVLMKQTKNQNTYSFAGQKLTVNSEYMAY